MANVIEILLRAKDETGAALSKTKTNLLSIKSLIAGIATGIAFNALIENIKEAQEATAKLDSAFANTGKSAGVTRQRLDDLASEIQSTTTVSDELVKTAESVLLSFDRVRGQAFERTIKVAADLSARMGGDLVDAVRSVGFALQSPEEGLTRLRRAGIQFDEQQQQLIKGLVESGRASQAQSVILTELERRFGGAAQAARNTLGGALQGLKNSFGELFEGTSESGKGATEAINSLSKALSSPEIKSAFDSLIGALATVAQKTVEVFAGLKILFTGHGGDLRVDTLFDIDKAQDKKRYLQGQIKSSEITGDQNRLAKLKAELAEVDKDIDALQKRYQEVAFPAKSAAASGGTPALPAYDPNSSSPAAQRASRIYNVQREFEELSKWLDEYTAKSKQLAEDTRTHTQVIIDAYKKETDDVAEALKRGIINEEQAAEKRSEILEKYFADVDVSGFKKRIEKTVDETNQILVGGLRRVGESIQQTFSDLIYNGKLSLDTLRDTVRRVLADITASILTSGIANLLKDQFNIGGAGGGSGLGGVFGTVLSLFGGKAAGGYGSGWKLVGDDGPELVNLGSGSMVMNARQMAFARGNGGGGSFSYAPQFTLNVQGGGDNNQTIIEKVGYLMREHSKEFERKLERNGIPLR